MPESPRTIVYTHGGGRFGNQLMVFGHLIALAAEHPEFRIVNYSFWPYAGYCAGTESNARCEYPFSGRSPGVGFWLERTIRGAVWKRRQAAVNRIIGQALHKLMPWRSVSFMNDPGDISLSDPKVLAAFRSRKVSLLAGWRLREWDWFEKHQDVVRDFLKPASIYQAIADKLINDLRKSTTRSLGY